MKEGLLIGCSLLYAAQLYGKIQNSSAERTTLILWRRGRLGFLRRETRQLL